MGETKLMGKAFGEEILRRLAETAEQGYSVSMEKVDKNNGQKREGIVIRAEGSRISPVYYLDVMYEQYLQGMSIGDLIEGIWQFYWEEARKKQFDVNDFVDWSRVKKRLFLRVVSTEMNGVLLETTVHKEMLDLSTVVYVRMEAPADGGVASVTVRKEHLALWQQSEEEVYELALQNTRQDNITFVSITNAISAMVSEGEREMLFGDNPMEFDSPLYVLTNEAGHFGAVHMLLPEVMDRIADEKEEDLYILPSSINEIMVLAVSEVHNLSCLREIVQDINEMQVPVEQRLSNHVYRYSKGKGLAIVA